MTARQHQCYPSHLAQYASRCLNAIGIAEPSAKILLRLFETLYFASLKTDEARPCRCTVNYIDPMTHASHLSLDDRDSGWKVIRFRQPDR